MALKDDLQSAVTSILSTKWELTDGQAVPETQDIKLDGGGRWLEATILYADLADSTALVTHDKQMAARIFKCFLSVATKIIRHHGGHIRSFDGDRVMGIFIENRKNTEAAKTALSIKWAFETIVRPRLSTQYPKLADGTLALGYCCGIDTGKILVVRSGIRGNNDLLWVGRAANIAAKLSTIRKAQYLSFITEAVYKSMNDEAKISSDGRPMWTLFQSWKDAGVIYGSTWQWSH